MKSRRVNNGCAVTYHPDVASVVQDLARREVACCGFLDTITEPTGHGIRMVMTSENSDALSVIDLLIGSPNEMT